MQTKTTIDYQGPEEDVQSIEIPLRVPSYMVRHDVQRIIIEYRQDYRRMQADHEAKVAYCRATPDGYPALDECIAAAEVAYGDALVERLRQYEWSCFDAIVDYRALPADMAALVRSTSWRETCDFDAVTAMLTSFRGRLRC